MDVWRPRRLTLSQMEERRLTAAELLESGELSQAEIARRFGVSEAAVSKWQQRLREEGPSGLRRRSRARTPGKLSDEEWEQLGQLLRAGAIAAGFESEQWTLRRIAALIEREFGVHYHFRSLSRPLHAHGFSPQQPVARSAERNEELVRAWLEHDWPEVKKKLAAGGTRLPSWTRRVTRFGPVSAPPGHR